MLSTIKHPRSKKSDMPFRVLVGDVVTASSVMARRLFRHSDRNSRTSFQIDFALGLLRTTRNLTTAPEFAKSLSSPFVKRMRDTARSNQPYENQPYPQNCDYQCARLCGRGLHLHPKGLRTKESPGRLRHSRLSPYRSHRCFKASSAETRSAVRSFYT